MIIATINLQKPENKAKSSTKEANTIPLVWFNNILAPNISSMSSNETDKLINAKRSATPRGIMLNSSMLRPFKYLKVVKCKEKPQAC